MNLFDRDSFSNTYGFADRSYWGWKVSDFSNGTLQGAVMSLAIGLKLSKKYQGQKEEVLEVIKSGILACEKIRAKNGSMAEAYPNENSFCVTALVAHDVLSAIKFLDNDLDTNFKKRAFEIVRPLIEFITKNDEEHAIISNHLATAVAAIELWNNLTGANSSRSAELLEIIKLNQSNEGWLKEYESADPGYQTLCTYYLASAHYQSDSLGFINLDASLNFLSHFVHPDGSIGGTYGSRNTEVYYPGGIEYFASKNDKFRDLQQRLLLGIKNGKHLLPENIDIGNYVPLLNAYAFAAYFYSDKPSSNIGADTIEIDFPDAGLFVKKNENYHAILNYKKGGLLKVYDCKTKNLDYSDNGYFGNSSNDKVISNQQFDSNGSFNTAEIKSIFYYVNQSTPSAFSTLVLRALSLTFFKSVSFGNWFKKRIVKMLMTGKKPAGGSICRKVHFFDNRIDIKDKVIPPKHSKNIQLSIESRAIHMASSGYYISKNKTQSKIVHSIQE